MNEHDPSADALDPIASIEAYKAEVERLTNEMFGEAKARHPSSERRGAVIYRLEDYR